MKRLLAGATLLAAGTVATIEAHRHRPLPPPAMDVTKLFRGGNVLGVITLYRRDAPWSRTVYDVAHIGGAFLIVSGALLLIVTFLGLARRAGVSRADS
jgi:hypothetical protein